MLVELRGSQSVHARDLHFCQADFASAYESERRGRFHAQKLAFRIRTLPQKVRDVISGLVGRGNQNWDIVVLSKERGGGTVGERPRFWRQVRQYQVVLRGARVKTCSNVVKLF